MNGSETSFSRRSTPGPALLVIDPFIVGEDHPNHQTSTSIIKLEDSGRLFCPLCLDANSSEDISRTDYELYHQYVVNLFEALDQHGEKDQLRKILLSILEIVLKKRPFNVRQGEEFHNLLRIIYKIMSSDKFNLNEFSSVSRILSGLSIESVRPIPLKSAWNATQHILSYVDKTLSQSSLGYERGFPEEFARFYAGLAIVVRTYLRVVNLNAIDGVSDVVFPLYANDTRETLCRRYYAESQTTCLNLIIDNLVKRCWYYLNTADYVLGEEEKNMIVELYGCINEGFITAIRVNNRNGLKTEFLNHLREKDFMALSHSLIYRNREPEFRINIKKYLKLFVIHYIEVDYGTDVKFDEFKSLDDITETNHRNALEYTTNPFKYAKSIFYILINCIAIKQNSRYFNQTRVKRMIRNVNPITLGIIESRVLLRAYVFVLATVVPDITGCRNVEGFIKLVWERIQSVSGDREITEIFCYEEQVFNWLHKYPTFISFLDIDSICYILDRSVKEGKVDRCVTNMLLNDPLRHLLNQYLKEDDRGAVVFSKIVENDSDIESKTPIELDTHLNLIYELNAIIPPIMDSCILEYLQAEDNSNRLKSGQQIVRIIYLINMLLSSCRHSDLNFDDQTVFELTKIAESLYSNGSSHDEELIIAFNEFINQLILSNNPKLMKFLQHLNFSVLGYMYERLADYTTGDKVAESVAHVVVSYDNLDYPLRHNIEQGLYPMIDSVANWMLSSSYDLQYLSMRLVPKLLKPNCQTAVGLNVSDKTKAKLTTTFIHMVFNHPELIHKHTKAIGSILRLEEFKYNPLLDILLQREKDALADEVPMSQSEYTTVNRPPSPAMSFESLGTGLFEEDHMTVSRILDQLHEDVENRGNEGPSTRIPRCIILSRLIPNTRSTASSADEWETRAYNMATQSTETQRSQ